MSYQNSNFVLKHGKLSHKNKIRWVNSPNFSKSIDPKFLILHYTASPSLSSSVNWFKNPNAKASAQFLIDWDGTIIQMVRTTNRAWHAGRSNYRGLTSLNRYSIGIEMVNYGNMEIVEQGVYRTWFGKIVREGDYLATDGYSHQADIIEAVHPIMGGEKYGWIRATPEQIESTIYLGSYLMNRLGLEECLGHDHISRGRKWDTGPTLPQSVFDRINSRSDDSPISKNENNYIVSVNSTLNMRDSAGGAVIATLHNGEIVQVIGKEGLWFEVVTFQDSMKGWVHSNFLVKS